MRIESHIADVPGAGPAAMDATVLFAPKLNRAALHALARFAPVRAARLAVVRNHAVEHALSSLPALFSPWRLSLESVPGAYDDSLTFADLPDDMPVLVWLDFSRFALSAKSAEFRGWFFQRLAALRKLTEQPILVVDCVESTLAGAEWADLPGIALCPVGDVVSLLGVERVFDLRAAKFSGTPFSSAFLLEVARVLAAGPLAGALGLGIKAIVCDLDHTLYDGVLGEDGVAGVQLSAGRRQFQERLRDLRDKGILLAALSRNTPEDVAALFAERTDFALAMEDFVTVEASWDPKRIGMGRVLEKLRVGSETVLFLDDNPGELLDVAEAWPQVHGLPANDAGLVRKALEVFPGILAHLGARTLESKLRTADLRSGADRASLAANAVSDGEYFRTLNVRIELSLDMAENSGRLAELSGKTNQFNLTMGRLPLARVQALTEDPAGFALAISLKDRLSDSGAIAGWCGRIEGDRLVTEDLVISCRALGRRLETVLLAAAFRFVAERSGVKKIVLPWTPAPRNQPALRWLEQMCGGPLAVSPAVIDVPALPPAASQIEFIHRHHA